MNDKGSCPRSFPQWIIVYGMSKLHKMHQLFTLKLILTSQTLVVKALCQRPIWIPIFFWLSFSIKYHSIWIKKLVEKVNLIFLILSLSMRVVICHLIIYPLFRWIFHHVAMATLNQQLRSNLRLMSFYKRIRRDVHSTF